MENERCVPSECPNIIKRKISECVTAVLTSHTYTEIVFKQGSTDYRMRIHFPCPFIMVLMIAVRSERFGNLFGLSLWCMCSYRHTPGFVGSCVYVEEVEVLLYYWTLLHLYSAEEKPHCLPSQVFIRMAHMDHHHLCCPLFVDRLVLFKNEGLH